MILILVGDLHGTGKTPENRMDDYWGTWKRKLNYVVDYANECGAAAILQPGDLTDSANIPYNVTAEMASIIQRFQGAFISIEGQHDLRFHNPDNTNRPHWLLQVAGIVKKPTEEPIRIENAHIYGASWEKEIPVPLPRLSPGDINVLLVHTMVIQDVDSKVWQGQESYQIGNRLLRKHKGYDLIVSGDNHQGFINEYQKQLLVNCGSMMRSTTAQADHRPFFVLFDTSTLEYEKVFIPIEPVETVLNMDAKEKEQQRDDKLNLFMETLKRTEAQSLEFENIVFTLLRSQPDIDPVVRTMVEGFFE